MLSARATSRATGELMIADQLTFNSARRAEILSPPSRPQLRGGQRTEIALPKATPDLDRWSGSGAIRLTAQTTPGRSGLRATTAAPETPDGSSTGKPTFEVRGAARYATVNGVDVHDQIRQRRRERKALRSQTSGYDIKSTIGAPLEQQPSLIGHSDGGGTFRATANPQLKYVPTANGRKIDRQGRRNNLTGHRIKSSERLANRNITRPSAAGRRKRDQKPDCGVLDHWINLHSYQLRIYGDHQVDNCGP